MKNKTYAVYLKPGSDFSTHVVKAEIRQILQREEITFTDTSSTWWRIVRNSNSQFLPILHNDNKVLKEMYFGANSSGKTGAILYVSTSDEKRLNTVKNEMIMELGMHIEYHVLQESDYTRTSDFYPKFISYINKKFSTRSDMDYLKIKNIKTKMDSTKDYTSDELLKLVSTQSFRKWDREGRERLHLKLLALNEYNKLSVK